MLQQNGHLESYKYKIASQCPLFPKTMSDLAYKEIVNEVLVSNLTLIKLKDEPIKVVVW